MTKYIAVALALLTAACAGSPMSPSGEPERMEWTVNGQTYTATSNGRGALRGGGTIFLTGASCNSGSHMGMQIGAVTAPGTYAIGAPGVNAVWTPDASSGAAAGVQWEAPGPSRVVGGTPAPGGGVFGGTLMPGAGTGWVTVTAITSEWISGSFSFQLVPGLSTPDTTPRSVQGSFELSFKERTIC